MSALEEKLYASLDMSGNMARFALVRGDGSVICRTRKPMRQREAAGLGDFVFESLACAKHEITEIGFWTIGSGPGSFTGMRLVAALVAGLSRENGVQVRCVPTAVAIANTVEDLPEAGQPVIVLFDGRNQEILAFELTMTEDGCVPAGKSAVLNKTQVPEYFSAHQNAMWVTQAADADAVIKVASVDFALKVVEHFDPAELVLAKYQQYDGNFSRLEYIRPAVFPKKTE